MPTAREFIGQDIKHLRNVNDLSIQLITPKQFKTRHNYDNRIFIMCLC